MSDATDSERDLTAGHARDEDAPRQIITFLLVPGACHGGWWYEPLGRRLEKDGHVAIPITLAGLEDEPQLDQLITLASHIGEVVAEVPVAGPVALIGHSYAGSVITAVADRLPERIAAMVYLDAFLPEDGDSCWSMANDEQRDWFVRGSAATGYGIDPLPFFAERARPHPVTTVLQAVALTGDPGRSSCVQRARESQIRGHGAVEAHDFGDAVASDGNHLDAGEMQHARHPVTSIFTPSRLPVHTHRNHPRYCASMTIDSGEEPVNCLDAPVFEGCRRHPHPHVVRHQCDELVDVELSKRSDEPVKEFPLLGTTRDWGHGTGGMIGRHGGPRTFQGTGHRVLGQPQEGGGFAGAVAQHVSQNEHRTLVGRQHLHRGDECQRDRLTRFVTTLWAGRLVGYSVKEQVGIGL